MSNEELFKLFRESDEASFTIWLEKNIDWVEIDCGVDWLENLIKEEE